MTIKENGCLQEILQVATEGKSERELSALIVKMYDKAKEEAKAELKEKFNRENGYIDGRLMYKNSIAWVSGVLEKVDKLLYEYGLRIRVTNGLHFDDDENGNVRVSLTIVKD